MYLKQKKIYVVYRNYEDYDSIPYAIEAFETKEDAEKFIEDVKSEIMSEDKFNQVYEELNCVAEEIGNKYYESESNIPLYENADKEYEAAIDEWEISGMYKFLEEQLGITEDEYNLAEQEYMYYHTYYTIQEIAYNYHD